MGRGEATELSNRIEKEVDQATGFRSHERSHKPSASIRQEEDLKLYLDFIKFILRKPRDTSDEVMKAEAFPEDFKELSTYLRKFIIFAFNYTDPRSQATGEAIQYRDSMLFWAKRMFNERDHVPPLAANCSTR